MTKKSSFDLDAIQVRSREQGHDRTKPKTSPEQQVATKQKQSRYFREMA